MVNSATSEPTVVAVNYISCSLGMHAYQLVQLRTSSVSVGLETAERDTFASVILSRIDQWEVRQLTRHR